MSRDNKTFTGTPVGTFTDLHRRPSKGKVIGLVVGVFMALNVAVFVGYQFLPNGAADEAVAPPPAAAEAPQSAQVGELARANKLAGLEAMERGDYEAAVSYLTDAAREGDESPELVRLLALAQEMRGRYGQDEPAPTAVAAAPETDESESEEQADEEPVHRERLQTAIRQARRAWRPSRRQQATNEAPAGALPQPAEQVEETPEALATPTAEPTTPSPEALTAPEPEVTPPAPPPTPQPRMVARTVEPVVPPTTRRRRPARRAAPVRYGQLEVRSPNVYGEVFINGRSYGYPPRVIRRVPAGRARVEIRVDGTARRSRTVQVRPDQSRLLTLL